MYCQQSILVASLADIPLVAILAISLIETTNTLQGTDFTSSPNGRLTVTRRSMLVIRRSSSSWAYREDWRSSIQHSPTASIHQSAPNVGYAPQSMLAQEYVEWPSFWGTVGIVACSLEWMMDLFPVPLHG